MLERINKILQKCNKKRLEQQCENEDLAKEILFYSTDKPPEKKKNRTLFVPESESQQNERRKFLNKRIEQRKNLYIYPEQV